MSDAKSVTSTRIHMDVRPKGFWSRSYEIRSQHHLVGTAARGFFNVVKIDLETGDALQIKRRGFFSDYYELRLRSSMDLLGIARGRGFLRRCYDVEIGDVQGVIGPATWFGGSRDYSVDHRVVATTERRGLFSRGFRVSAAQSVSEIEMLFFGWVAYIIRQQQSGSNAPN